MNSELLIAFTAGPFWQTLLWKLKHHHFTLNLGKTPRKLCNKDVSGKHVYPNYNTLATVLQSIRGDRCS